jgi:uncharacterized membrane protein YeaQ/YmgE (transglycosylase-associated protein family)
MDIFIWSAVGLVAGISAWLLVHDAKASLGSHLAFGIVGAFIGGVAFREFGWPARFPGLAGAITVAFAGAIAVLIAMQLAVGMKRGRLRY